MKHYVINLDRSKDRLEHVEAAFQQAGLDFLRVSAVDGRALPDEDFERLTRIRNWSKPLTRTEVGCFLSHLACLKLIAEGDDPYGAIFEDDINLSPNAALFLKDWKWIPKGCDIVKIDTAETVCVLGRFDTTLQQNYRLAPLISKHYCAGGYIVSKACARYLYESNQQVTAPIDEIYFNPECGVLQTMKVEQMVPAIVVQAGLVSTIRAPMQKKKHKSSNRSLAQKLGREVIRLEKRYLYPLRMKIFRGYFWGVVPFK
ncbi:glycosyltransferase family 25 protein [Bartonella sp. LJL80]